VTPPEVAAAASTAHDLPRGWPERLRRMAVVPLLALYLAGPGWVMLSSPLIPTWIRVSLLALFAVAAIRPRWSPALLIGVVPLLPVWPSIVPGMPYAIVHLVVATQAIPWFVFRLLGRRGERSTLAPGWAVLVGIATVSLLVLFTPEPWRGADGRHVLRLLHAQAPAYIFEAGYQHGPSVLREWTVLMDGLSCAFVVGWATTRQTRERTLRAAGLAAITTALFGLVQASTGFGLQDAWRVFDAGIIRINATYTDPNALAAFYALVGPVLAACAMRTAGWRRVTWAAGAALVLVAMVMTAGRAGLAALATGMLAMAWVALRRDLDTIDASAIVRRHARRVVRAAVVGVVSVLVAFVLLGTTLDIRHEQQTSYLHTWLYTFNLRQPADAIAKGRIAVWRVALAMIRERPLVGQGVGQARVQFERVRSELGIESLPRNAQLSPHNTYLLVTSELGLLGLAALLLMMVAVAIGIRAPGNLPARDPATWPMAGLVGGLVGYTLTMLTGDRILLREDVVVGTICATLATLGAPVLPRWWRVAAFTLLGMTLASWPVRTGWVGGTPLVIATPPHEGVHSDQIGARGETYRWSTGDTVLYVPADARRVRIPVRNLSPRVQRLDVAIDDRPADLRQLESGPWVTLDYRLPPRPGGRWHAIRLQVTPTWKVPGDDRVLGVVIGEWGFER
jgi:O-antigen ligase